MVVVTAVARPGGLVRRKSDTNFIARTTSNVLLEDRARQIIQNIGITEKTNIEDYPEHAKAKPYAEKNTIYFRAHGHHGVVKSNELIKAKIMKTFEPFTMSPVMRIGIHNSALAFEGDFVLKVFNRRYTSNIRGMNRIEEWNLAREAHYRKHVHSATLVKYFDQCVANDDLYYDPHDEDGGRESKDEQNGQICETELKHAYEEAWVHAFCIKMHKAEVEVYRRTQDVGGADVPRFKSNVTVPDFDANGFRYDPNLSSSPGILIQYIDGFSLQDLCNHSISPAPQSAWLYIIEDALRIVRLMRDRGIRNLDCCPRNTVVHWDQGTQRFKCKMLDFGHCVFRPEHWSEMKWHFYQFADDEEAHIGEEMEILLEKKKGGGYTYVESEWRKQLIEECIDVDEERFVGEADVVDVV
jgi:hypothetical protein